MLSVIDYRTSEEVINNLRQYTEDIFLFRTDGITYNSISCHPDIFIYQDEENLIIAPNSPSSLSDFFKDHKISFTVGEKSVGTSFEGSVFYNCLSTPKFLFHKEDLTENRILKVNHFKKFLDLPQAYTRCSLIHLKDEIFITSDKGIKKELNKNNLHCFYFDPSEITISDHKNGFIGGTAGVINNKIFFNGNIDLHKDGPALRNFINDFGIEIVCLGSHKLYDGGCIFFFE